MTARTPAPHAPAARAGAGLRLLRAAVFAAVCVALSAGGHVLASGAGVPLWALGAAGVAVFAVAALAAGRERSLPGIAALLAVGQLVLHCVYGAGQHGAPRGDGGVMALARRLVCHESGPLSAGQARRIVDAAGVSPGSGSAGGTGALGGTGSTAHSAPTAGHAAAAHMAHMSPWDMCALSLPMLLGHLIAALAAGWLLRRGERALWRLVRLAAGTGAAPLRAAVRLAALLCAGLPGLPEPRPAASPADRDETPPPRHVLLHAVTRRGPPAYALAA